MVSTLLKLPVLIYQLVNWLLNADGTVSDNVVKAIVRPGDLIFSATPLVADASRLLCDGSVVARETYADLFAAIGTVYGAGDGSTTFKLPDYRNFFPVGAGVTYALGSTGGEATHVLGANEMPGHRHQLINADDSLAALTADNFIAHTNSGDGAQSFDYLLYGTTTEPSIGLSSEEGGDGSATAPALSPAAAHNNVPPFVACFILIKT